jgi:hypothetical protein
LSIDRIYYDSETCVKKINQLVSHDEIKKYHFELSDICKELCKLDKNFPPKDLWIDYYDVKNLANIINIDSKKKKNEYHYLH